MRKCGRRYGSEGEALTSKRGLTGQYGAVPCVCEGWHLRPVIAPRAAERKAPADTGPDARTRALVLGRDGYACVCCGISILGKHYSLQHRQRRSQGGDNSPVNLLTVLGDGTTGCHARIDSRIDPHDEAKGYTVRSFDDPAAIPVMYFSENGSGILAWLEPDGGLSFEPPRGIA
jgi:hypothetical protein